MSKVIIDPIKATEQFKADLAKMAEGQKKPGEIKQRLLTKNFGLAQFKANRWRIELPEAQTLEHALDPSFFSAQADEIMRPQTRGRGDIIEVWKPDTSQYAELIVLETGKGYVRTMLLRQEKPSEVAIPEASALGTRWNAGTKTHEVIRKADNVVMQQGFQTKAAAAAWIADHMAKVAA